MESRVPRAKRGDLPQDAAQRVAGPVHQAAPSRTSTTCAPTRSSVPRRASTTATGWPTGCSSRFRCRVSPPSGWRASRISPAPETRELQPRRGDAENGRHGKGQRQRLSFGVAETVRCHNDDIRHSKNPHRGRHLIIRGGVTMPDYNRSTNAPETAQRHGM